MNKNQYHYEDIGFVYPYFLGRNALFRAAKELRQRGIQTISVPAYSCGDEVEAIHQAGMKIMPYDVELADGKFSIASETNGESLLATNYFGMRLPYSHDNPTIVDNAYCFDFNNPIGDEDFSIISLRKQLYRPNGAFLITNEPLESYVPELPPDTVLDYETENHAGYSHNRPQGSGIHPGIDTKNIFGARYDTFGGYGLTSDDKLPANEDCSRRSENLRHQYAHCMEILDYYVSDYGLSLARKIQEDQVLFPTMLPILVDDSSVTYQHLQRTGVGKVIPFWSKSPIRYSIDDYPGAKKIKKSIVALSFLFDWNADDYTKLKETLASGALR